MGGSTGLLSSAPPKGKAKEQKDPVDFSAGQISPPDAEDVKDGLWDRVCTFRTLPDGRIRLVQVGDTKLPDPENKEKQKKFPDRKPDYRELVRQTRQGLVGEPDGQPQE